MKSPNGFTLIELLVVIAVIGVLATVALVAINPLEMINRARDSVVRTETIELNRAVDHYYAFVAAPNGLGYPNGAGVNGQQPFISTGELKQPLISNGTWPSYQIPFWVTGNASPPYIAFQIDSGALKSNQSRQQAAQAQIDGNGYNCDNISTKANVEIFFRSDIPGLKWYCW